MSFLQLPGSGDKAHSQLVDLLAVSFPSTIHPSTHLTSYIGLGVFSGFLPSLSPGVSLLVELHKTPLGSRSPGRTA